MVFKGRLIKKSGSRAFLSIHINRHWKKSTTPTSCLALPVSGTPEQETGRFIVRHRVHSRLFFSFTSIRYQITHFVIRSIAKQLKSPLSATLRNMVLPVASLIANKRAFEFLKPQLGYSLHFASVSPISWDGLQ